MDGFGLLCGHLVGDFLSQGDYQALNKTRNSWVCALHCTMYTLCVWLFACWWFPWWALPVCWLSHFPMDRWRLAREFMRWRQDQFATGPLAPWSIIVVDGTYHLVVLFLIGMLAI